MKKNIIIAILVILLSLSLSWGYFLSQQQRPSTFSLEKNIRRELLQELRDKGVISPIPSNIFEVRGKVKKIEQDSIIIKPLMQEMDPLGEIFPDQIKVSVKQDTKMVKIVPKDKEVYEKELKEAEEKFARKVLAGESTEGLTRPAPDKEVEISLNQIEEGEVVIVKSKNNLKGKEKIKATQINFQSE